MTNTTLEKWEEKTLGEILDKGSSNLSANKLNDCVGIYPVYGASGLIAKVNFYQQDKEYLAIIKDGAGVGKVYHYQPKTSVLGTLQYLYPKPNTNIRFAYYYLQSIDFAKYYQGAAIPHIYYRDYKSEKLVLPPLPEQERIVAKLDKAFEAIDKVKANAEQNLNNAKELFESALNNVFTKNTDGWEEKKLDDVCTYKSGTTISKDLEKDTGDLLYIKVGDMNIRGNEELITTSTRFASSAEISAAQIIPTGSVIFPKRGGAIATNKKRKIIKPTIVDLNTMAIIPNKELDSNFFYYWFGQINLIDISNGTTIPQINNYSFQNLRIKYPTLLEQQKIVEQLDKIQEKTKKLEAIYTQKIKECDELKQSILQKAFRGEL